MAGSVEPCGPLLVSTAARAPADAMRSSDRGDADGDLGGSVGGEPGGELGGAGIKAETDEPPRCLSSVSSTSKGCEEWGRIVPEG